MKAKAILITSAVVAGGLGFGWLVTGHSDTPPVPAAAAAEPAGTTITPPSGFAGTAPKDVTWQLVNTIAVPVSPAAGPTKVSPEGIRSGYTHDPAGALLAAANYAAADAERLTAPGPATTALYDQRVLPWPGRDQDKLQAEAEAAHPNKNPMVMQIMGYRWLSYDGDHATILIAEHITNVGAQKPAFIPWINLVWTDGDWWIVPAVDGQGEISTPGVYPLNPTFTAWAGVA
ncbi:MAG TPA: hypothetical protein VFC16_00645 [Nakamurella sp.]|nr:hypothetical protein [Nakamurella sp.]